MANVGRLPETDIAPENGWLEDYFSFGEGLFSGATAMIVLVDFHGTWKSINHTWILCARVASKTGPPGCSLWMMVR